MAYSVVITPSAQSGLSQILDNPNYTPQNRLAYLLEVETLCNSLSEMPRRFSEVRINHKTYRSFTYKSHRVFYKINDDIKQVGIIAVLHVRQLPEKHVI